MYQRGSKRAPAPRRGQLATTMQQQRSESPRAVSGTPGRRRRGAGPANWSARGGRPARNPRIRAGPVVGDGRGRQPWTAAIRSRGGRTAASGGGRRLAPRRRGSRIRRRSGWWKGIWGKNCRGRATRGRKGEKGGRRRRPIADLRGFGRGGSLRVGPWTAALGSGAGETGK
ncbi:unnamed protein product [Urochloa humidicola]